jgi:hypothetical protein
MLIAIDPGVSGGIAYEDTDGSVHALAMPETVADLRDALAVLVCEQTVVVLEELPKFGGKMSALSMGIMFRNFGRIEGILTAFRVRVHYVAPKVWQKALSLGDKKTHGDRWKAHLKARAQALFPRLDVTLKTADALLILEAGKKIL